MPEGEIVLYRTDDGLTEVQLRALDGSVWLAQAEIAELFQTTRPNVTQHIKAIHTEGELAPEATSKEYLQVRQEGAREVRRTIVLYSLEMILAVGYRVRSPRGVQFRQWATAQLREYLVKGFVLDERRLKEPGPFDYFDELLEKIREIRASEKRFYQKVRDVYATAADYDPRTDAAQLFFAAVQNKMLFAVCGRTAAELITVRADASAANMGLTSWKGGRVRKGDVEVAKNYLAAEEVGELNRVVTMFLDFAEDQARRRKAMTMAQWAARLDDFLTFNDRPVLAGAGRISADAARRLAHERFETFDTVRRAAETRDAEAEHIEELKRLTDASGRKPASAPRPPSRLPRSAWPCR